MSNTPQTDTDEELDEPYFVRAFVARNLARKLDDAQQQIANLNHKLAAADRVNAKLIETIRLKS